jgi:hypothetical protein
MVRKPAKGQLGNARMLPGGEFYNQGQAAIDRLLRYGAISGRTYWAVIKKKKIGEEILQKNVFSHHPYPDNITFQSTSCSDTVRS